MRTFKRYGLIVMRLHVIGVLDDIFMTGV